MNEVTKLNLSCTSNDCITYSTQYTQGLFFGRQWKYIKADEQTRQFVVSGWVMQWLKRI